MQLNCTLVSVVGSLKVNGTAVEWVPDTRLVSGGVVTFGVPNTQYVWIVSSDAISVEGGDTIYSGGITLSDPEPGDPSEPGGGSSTPPDGNSGEPGSSANGSLGSSLVPFMAGLALGFVAKGK